MANNNINIPQNEFLNPDTGRPSQPWLMWLMNPSVLNITLGSALGIISGGTGVITAPTNGQLLIGNNGAYSLNTLSQGNAITVANGAGSITINNDGVTSLANGTGISVSAFKGDITISNTGVLSLAGSTGISVSGSTGNITITNTGVTSLVAGTGISVSSSTGRVTVTNTGVTSFTAGSTGLTPSTATTGSITLAGILNVANGGTGLDNLPATLIPYGNGTSAFQYIADFYFANNSTFDREIRLDSSLSNVKRALRVRTATGQIVMGIDSTNLTYLYSDGPMLFATGGNEQIRILTSGAISFGSSGTNYGASGNVLTSSGSGASPYWTAGVSGTFVSANIPPKTITVTNGIITSIV